MPKIPKGNFKTEASSQIGRARFSPIQSNSQGLKQLGRQAAGISNAIEKADTRVRSLNSVKESSESWEKEKENNLDKLFNLSKGGYLDKGTDVGGEILDERTKLEDVIRTRSNKLNKEYVATAGVNNPEGSAMVNKYVSGDIDRYVDKAKVFASNQVVKDTYTGLQAKATEVIQKYANGDADDNDLAMLLQGQMDASLLIGNDRAVGLNRATYQSLAMNSRDMVLNRPDGLTPENLAKVRGLISKLPSHMQVVANSNLKSAIERREIMDVNKRAKANSKIITTIDSPLAMAQMSKEVNEAISGYTDVAPNQYETAQGKVRDYVSMQGKVSAMSLLGSVVQEDGGTVSSLSRLKSSDARVGIAIEEEVDRLYRGLASSEMSKFSDVEKVKDSLRTQIRGEINQVYKKRDEPNGFMGFVKKFEPTLARKVASNKPEETIPELFNMYKTTGGASDQFSLNALEDIKADGKSMKELLNRGDPNGEGYQSLANQNKARWGEGANSAIKESASKGGLAPSMIYSTEASDDMSNRIAVGHGNYQKHMLALVSNETMTSATFQKITPQAGAKQFEKKVKSAMESADLNSDALIFGANNDARYKGYVDSVKFMAATKAAGGMDMDEAISSTIQEMKEAFPSASDGVNFVGITAKYAKVNNIDTTKLKDTLNSAKSMEGYEELGYSLDMDELISGADKNPNLTKKFASVKQMGGSFSDFAEVFGDDLVVLSDPRDGTKMKTYIRDPKTHALTPIPVTKDGKDLSALSVPVDTYHNHFQFDGSVFGGTK